MLSSAGQIVGAATGPELEARLDALADEEGMTRDELTESFERRRTPVGTYDHLRERFAELEDLGITRFYIQGRFDAENTPQLLDALGKRFRYR
jgi:alkanesulfonate monooxygenase SsuD/methylene tetrahydromethanopterin reductase-like flavin-dependent oxidoreductase (luciferase family)